MQIQPKPKPSASPSVSEQPQKPKQACIDCHFLQYHGVSHIGTLGAGPFPLIDEDRAQIKSREYLDAQRFHWFECMQGVWNEGMQPLSDVSLLLPNRHFLILDRERKGKCYFFPRERTMTINTAKDLWKRAQDKKFTDSQNFLACANTGLAVVVAVATVIAAIATAAQVFKPTASTPTPSLIATVVQALNPTPLTSPLLTPIATVAQMSTPTP